MTDKSAALQTILFDKDDTALALDCNAVLPEYELAYVTYGKLNADKSNAILICHALTGDQFCSGTNPINGKDGWWSNLIGPGKTIDTDNYFVICSNILGGCMGSTGPSSKNPKTQKTWASDFPVITIQDMVRAQKKLVEHFGIEKLFAVIGGSMGGMQILAWASLYPDSMHAVVPIATAARHSAQNIAFHEVGRQALRADPDWQDGHYTDDSRPRRGLAVARMIAHITYLSESALQRKFGRNLQDRSAVSFGFDADFQVESYLRYQGSNFVERFDANSYLYITRALDYFDLAADHDGDLSKAFKDSKAAFCVVSFSSDWLFPTSESRHIVHALNANGADVSFCEIESDKGHDAFLLHEPEFYAVIDGFLKGCAKRHGLSHVLYPDMDKKASKDAEKDALPKMPKKATRIDFDVISKMVDENARILDVGCGNGELLNVLMHQNKADGYGLELSVEGVQSAVAHGLSVLQGDANSDLQYYGDQTYDYAILSHTLQAMDNPKETLKQLVRIGKQAIVSFPNFGHWKIRTLLAFGGKMPVDDAIPYAWHETPNIHFCTMLDFENLCQELGITIEKRIAINANGRKSKSLNSRLDNLLAEQAVYLLKKN
jgi:homoserine O-acetyltransferase